MCQTKRRVGKNLAESYFSHTGAVWAAGEFKYVCEAQRETIGRDRHTERRRGLVLDPILVVLVDVLFKLLCAFSEQI